MMLLENFKIKMCSSSWKASILKYFRKVDFLEMNRMNFKLLIIAKVWLNILFNSFLKRNVKIGIS